jgi:hypothetical protein
MFEQQKFTFDGSDYVPERDDERLTRATEKIFVLMSDGKFRTLQRISLATGSPESSVSAILRHFRKKRFGSHTVNKKPLGHGLYAYQLIVNTEPPPPTLFDKENN